MNRAVFLDRDGTMAKDGPYCRRPEDFELFADTPDAVRLLKEQGFKVVVITNQSGIARGYFTEEALARIHDKMMAEITGGGASIDGVYYCPHHPDDNCDCRKPKTALIVQAAREHNIDLSSSFMVGDTAADMNLGRAAGSRTILVNRFPSEHAGDVTADAIVSDLIEAAHAIMNWEDNTDNRFD